MALFPIDPERVSSNRKLVAIAHTTVAASDTIDTGLSKVECVVASLGEDATDGLSWVSCAVPASGGTITVKTWKNTSGTDPTPAAATSFGAKVNLIVVGY